MATFYIVPGVYPREIDLTGRTTPISTTTGAMAFPSRDGPMETYFETDAVHFEEMYGPSDFKWTFAHAMIKAFLLIADGIYLKRVTKNAKYAGSIVANDVLGVQATKTTFFPFPSGRGDDYTIGTEDYKNIVFSGPIVTGNTVSIGLSSDNGTVHTFTQAFTTDSDTTLTLLAAQIDSMLATTPFQSTGYNNNLLNGGDCLILDGGSAANDTRVLRLLSPEGTVVTVTGISVSGGTSQATAQVISNPWLFEIWARNPGARQNGIGYKILNVEEGVAQRQQLLFSGPMLSGQQFNYYIQLNGNYIQTVSVPFNTSHLVTANNILNAIKTVLGNKADGWIVDSNGYQIVIVSPIDGPNTVAFSNITVTGSGSLPTVNVSQVLTGIANDDTFEIWIYKRDNINNPLERHKVSLFRQVDGNGQQLFIEDEVNTGPNKSDYIRIKFNSANAAGVLASIPDGGTPIQWLAGGDAGTLPSNSDIAAAWESAFLSRRKVPCRIMINGGHSSPIVQQEIDSLCQRRWDCFGILDMPSNYQQASDAVDYRTGVLDVNSNYSAIYTPDVLIADVSTNTTLFIPPSGHIAAKFAYNDNVAATWFAPAGLNRGLITQILGLRYDYDEGEMALLISNQINPIIKEYGAGYQIKSAETLQTKASALSNINVRRLLITIEVSLVQALDYSIFEPNTAYTRFLITQLVTAFLQPIKQGSGLYDYAVVCDDRNTTSYLIDQGQANVDIYLKPVLPIKYIQLTSVITKTGAYFQETIAAISGTSVTS